MKNQKGITLIALVITIIVMLILVGVSVTVALNGGLFTTAKKAKEDTATERDKEVNLSEGKVEINGELYNSIDEYISGVSSNNPEDEKPTNPSEPESPIDPSEPSGNYTSYSIGDTVTIETESFYVLKDSDATQEMVILLAKDCIDTITLKQSASAETVAFSSTDYWSNETVIMGLDLNNYPIPDGATSVITRAKEYGTTLGGIGRLMTKAEAEALETANRDILYGLNGKSSSEKLNYWLGSACLSDRVWDVGGVSGSSVLDSQVFENNEICGVRPVVEISKSNISE